MSADHLHPSPAMLAALRGSPNTGRVVMLNLLKFKRGGGSKEYGKYARAFEKILNAHGGRFLFLGRCAEKLAGGEDWDAIALVEYPSRLVFAHVVTLPEVKEIGVFREAGLERTVLYAIDPRD
ncbi:MAG: DUF1330 domain-containing protein [Bryobacteraceae bacterium]|nr:DUF1330 domain-containing protein [Bryobacteraceae bacterium]